MSLLSPKREYNFKEYFDSNDINLQLLPLCHTTDGFFARDILKFKRFEAKPCDVFEGERLLYFFYGKPTYRLSNLDTSTSLGSYWPVTFLISADKIEPNRIFPFDSGAFCKDRFNNFYRKEMEISSFQLKNTITNVPNFIGYFYENNNNYYLGKPIESKSLDIPSTFFELESYYEAIKHKSISNSDDRNSTIEIQTNHEIPLTNKCLELVVAPQVYFDDEEFRDSLLEHAKEVRGYQTSRGNPREFHKAIFNEVHGFMQKSKFL
jgi:hypothetical protein